MARRVKVRYGSHPLVQRAWERLIVTLVRGQLRWASSDVAIMQRPPSDSSIRLFIMSVRRVQAFLFHLIRRLTSQCRPSSSKQLSSLRAARSSRSRAEHRRGVQVNDLHHGPRRARLRRGWSVRRTSNTSYCLLTICKPKVRDGPHAESCSAKTSLLARASIILECIVRTFFIRVPSFISHNTRSTQDAQVPPAIARSSTAASRTKKYANAGFPNDLPRTTPVSICFSYAHGSRGSADAAHHVRGFAAKFCTNEGNWDSVGHNVPSLVIQDSIKFSASVYAVLKPEPHSEITQGRSAHNDLWDLIGLQPKGAWV